MTTSVPREDYLILLLLLVGIVRDNFFRFGGSRMSRACRPGNFAQGWIQRRQCLGQYQRSLVLLRLAGDNELLSRHRRPNRVLCDNGTSWFLSETTLGKH